MAERRKLNRSKTVPNQEGALMSGKEPPLPDADFCNIYRPSTFDDILGHDVIVRSVKDVLDSRSKRCFVLTGPSGCGKTTISRAIADYLTGGNADLKDYREVDGAVYSGADKARELVEWVRYKPFLPDGKKIICVDECHALSQQAYQCLLKSVEEPPPYATWIFCTTVSGKVPDTIMTRAASYNLDPLKADVLFGLLDVVNSDQRLGLDESILDIIAHESGGSPRQALTNLAKCRSVRDRAEAAEILQGAHDNPDLRNLCVALSTGNLSWDKAMRILDGLSNLDPEGIRIQIVLYFAAIVRNAKNSNVAAKAVSVMDNFLPGPLYSANKHAELYVMLARVLLQ